MNPFIHIITSANANERNSSFSSICNTLSINELFTSFQELDAFRKSSPNLYERVRASIFLYAGYRFHLMEHPEIKTTGHIPESAYNNLLQRNFEKAIAEFIVLIEKNGPNAALISSLAEAYHHITFQILADQVRKSVRLSRGNQWMFRVGHYDEHPLKIHPKLLQRSQGSELFPVLQEKTAVRMDLTHSCWSDIFFLGMDYPEGARVINVSVNLGVYNRDNDIKPPLESFLRVINEPVIRLTSLDLNVTKDISSLSELFNFGNDYLSLLKAAVIASGLIPPSFEGTTQNIEDILRKLVAPGMGIELVTKVNDIPKGSRLAVSTNLLASIISAIMRATHQTQNLEGQLNETERRIIASRAILGEWLGGSGGGWQDSGGIWPGIKAIEGTMAYDGEPEYNVSRGCLLPRHKVLSGEQLHPQLEENISKSLILFHGGMASNVGPILEMVTEKYLLRSQKEWHARQNANAIYDKVLQILKEGDIKKLAVLTSQNFNEPIKTIIPWATTFYTETIIKKARQEFGTDYWGFLMLGGMSGGGMGMFVNPQKFNELKERLLQILLETKKDLSASLPFAMDPVIYNFNINKNGSFSELKKGNEALMPSAYYALHIPILVKENSDRIPEVRKIEIDIITSQKSNTEEAFPLLRSIVGSLFRFSSGSDSLEKKQQNELAENIKEQNGFDSVQHEQIKEDFRKGRIGLSRNRLPAETIIEDVESNEVTVLSNITDSGNAGEKALRSGEIAVFSLAAGVGSRWTKGAGVIKAINPFVEMAGSHRSFLEIHLAKANKTAQHYSTTIPFIVATSYLTHGPIESCLAKTKNYGYSGKVYLSPGKSIGQRLIPMERDLRFLWEEMPQEQLDENKQKVREASREALIGWAKSKGEATDYTENLALQRLSPLGHWYEVANMIRNGTLSQLLKENANCRHIMLHNIDTLGVELVPEALAYHIESGNALTFEVVPRRIEDKGGGLAKINGKVRLLEGLAQPHENDELSLSYYNTLTTWINIEKLLNLFGLQRTHLLTYSSEELADAVRRIARRMPSYVTIKDVKYRWGHGQEDIYPVAQIEKLWGDMSALPDVKCGYLVVSRMRGQQLKDPAQLDAWVTDGSKAYVEGLCIF